MRKMLNKNMSYNLNIKDIDLKSMSTITSFFENYFRNHEDTSIEFLRIHWETIDDKNNWIGSSHIRAYLDSMMSNVHLKSADPVVIINGRLELKLFDKKLTISLIAANNQDFTYDDEFVKSLKKQFDNLIALFEHEFRHLVVTESKSTNLTVNSSFVDIMKFVRMMKVYFSNFSNKYKTYTYIHEKGEYSTDNVYIDVDYKYETYKEDDKDTIHHFLVFSFKIYDENCPYQCNDGGCILELTNFGFNILQYKAPYTIGEKSKDIAATAFVKEVVRPNGGVDWVYKMSKTIINNQSMYNEFLNDIINIIKKITEKK